MIILGDGTRWIWDLVDEHYPQAIQMVDWFHTCEYLAPVAKAAFSDPAHQETWIQTTTTALWNGQLDEVIAACQQHDDPNREGAPAQRAVTYYTHNQQHMDSPRIGLAAIRLALARLRVAPSRLALSA